MVDLLLGKIDALAHAARDTYNVDPVVFLIIFLAASPVFYYSLFRVIRAIARGAGKGVAFWSTVFSCSVVAPFLYVLLFGRNLPWWAYGVIALLIGRGVLSLVTRLRRKPVQT